MSSSTRLLFCTTGVLLRRLEEDSTLKHITHIIVDEVHERSEERYFLEYACDASTYEQLSVIFFLFSAIFSC